MDFSYLDLQAVADRGEVFAIDLLGIKFVGIRAWLVIRAGPRKPGLGSITEPCSKTNPVKSTPCRGRFFNDDLRHLRLERIGRRIEDAQIVDVIAGIVEILCVRDIRRPGDLNAQGIPEGVRILTRQRLSQLRLLGEYGIAAEKRNH